MRDWCKDVAVCGGSADNAPDGNAAYTLPPPSLIRWPPPPPLTKDRAEISQMLEQLGLLQDPQPVRTLAACCVDDL
jgi:hypothetical protein